MLNMKNVFEQSLLVGFGKPGAITTLDHLAGAFRIMQRGLAESKATDEDRRDFLAAIENAIDEDKHLNRDQRAGVKVVLQSAFSGILHERPEGVIVVNASFLTNVRFKVST